MRRPTVWFNKNLSSTFDVVEAIRQTGDDVRVVCSHTDPDSPVSRAAELFQAEPHGLGEADYLDYCLGFVQRHAVDVFVPGKQLRAIVRHRQRFEALGVRVVAAADADTLDLLESKAALYAALGRDVVPIPDFDVVHDLRGFDAAYARLRGRHPTVCIKPDVSMFGLGFKVVIEGGSEFDRMVRGDLFTVGLDEARRALGERSRFRDVLVMQFLSGAERSVDCLSHQGELICCVVRRKASTGDGPQLLEDNPSVVSMVSRLTERLRLNGVFNVQFRDADEVPHLLEINPRMSGGLFYACLSGVVFPYWAVRLALGTATPSDVPRPRTGIRVVKVNRAIAL